MYVCDGRLDCFHLCLLMFTCVYPYSLVFTCVYLYSPVFSHGYLCLVMVTYVYLCLLMFLCVRSVFEEYTRQYQSLKGLRTLEWKPPVGLIDLEIELGDEVKQFCVSPPRAVIALLFQDKG